MCLRCANRFSGHGPCWGLTGLSYEGVRAFVPYALCICELVVVYLQCGRDRVWRVLAAGFVARAWRECICGMQCGGN